MNSALTTLGETNYLCRRVFRWNRKQYSAPFRSCPRIEGYPRSRVDLRAVLRLFFVCNRSQGAGLRFQTAVFTSIDPRVSKVFFHRLGERLVCSMRYFLCSRLAYIFPKICIFCLFRPSVLDTGFPGR